MLFKFHNYVGGDTKNAFLFRQEFPSHPFFKKQKTVKLLCVSFR